MDCDAVVPPPNLQQALECLAADGLVAFPTETVWGLAARAESQRAVERLQRFKGRADDRPISVLIDEPVGLDSLGIAADPLLRTLVDAFWPGPLTLVIAGPFVRRFAAGIASPTGAVGFRCSDHPVAAHLVREAFGRGLGPLTATSFNRSGETPVETRAQAVLLAEAHGAPRVVVLEPSGCDAFARTPSTVLDLTGTEPRVLRWGAIDEKALAPLLAAPI